jgi:hypothetical protein
MIKKILNTKRSTLKKKRNQAGMDLYYVVYLGIFDSLKVYSNMNLIKNFNVHRVCLILFIFSLKKLLYKYFPLSLVYFQY